MTVQLLDGTFSARDAGSLLTALFEIKIKFHETQIQADSSEEQIKMRENRIKDLQNELKKTIAYLQGQNGPVQLKSDVEVE